MKTTIEIIRCDKCGKRMNDNEISISQYLNRMGVFPEDYCKHCLKGVTTLLKTYKRLL